ncbi:MAG: universal stress protein [Chloroflexi bacterium]|nr:universal stress protein [Chloroflexota bacterium]
MYQRILVPLDGSELAERVLPHATALASRMGAELLLVQVVPLSSQLAMLAAGNIEVGAAGGAPLAAMAEAEEAEAKRASEYLESVAERLRREGLEVQWEVRRGTAAAAIIDCAMEHDVSVIAISTRGRSGLGRLVFGSVADAVLRQSGKPVLVIKPAPSSPQREP